MILFCGIDPPNQPKRCHLSTTDKKRLGSEIRDYEKLLGDFNSTKIKSEKSVPCWNNYRLNGYRRSQIVAEKDIE